MKSDISMSVVRRLPRYYRFLGDLRQNGIVRISSKELANRMGLTASQIRQDLNCFGGFGQQGYGYNVDQLYAEIGAILGLQNVFKTVIIGAGNIGRAIAASMTLEVYGFHLIGVFDNKESMAGQLVHGLPVRHISGLDEFCHENRPEIAFLCVPYEAAFEISDQLADLKIKGFWNFTHSDIAMRHPEIPVENVHLGDSLMTLCYRISNM